MPIEPPRLYHRTSPPSTVSHRRWAQALVSLLSMTQWVPHSSRILRRVGTTKACGMGVCTTYNGPASGIAAHPSGSAQALAEDAGMGTRQTPAP
jgi:hypothetical protein